MIASPFPPPYGGIAKYLFHAVPWIVEQGYLVHVVEPPNRGRTGPPPGILQHAPAVEVEQRRVSGTVPVLAFVLRNAATLFPFLWRYMTPFVRRPLFTYRQVWEMAAWCMAVRDVCERRSVDIIHAFDSPWVQGVAAVWAGRRYGAKSVLSIFGELLPHREELLQFDSLSRSFRAITRYTLTRASVIASMTRHCRGLVRHVGLVPQNVPIVRFVAGMERFRPDVDGSAIRDRYLPPQGRLLLFVGQVRPRKGPRTLIAALPAVLEAHPSARLVVVGPDLGGYTASLQWFAEELGVLENIHFVGPVPDEELPYFYAACDIFLFPTLTPIECLGLSFVQAMFAARPVIATRIAGAPEVVRDGIDGYLVEPADEEGFAAKISEVLGMPDPEREAMGRAGRERVHRLYDQADVLRDLDRLYRAALDA